ncbi:MAG: hypothetical protein ACON38_18495 [Akkermansiaceae bacterium]
MMRLKDCLPHLLVVLVGATVCAIQWLHCRDLEGQMERFTSSQGSVSTRVSHRWSSASPQERREGMMAELVELLPSREEKWEQPRILETLSGANAEDLLEILKKLDALPPDQQGVKGMVFLVEELLSELDPEAMMNRDYDSKCLKILASRSRDDALRWIDESDLDDRGKEEARLRVDWARLQIEPEKYLESWGHLKKCGNGDPLIFKPEVLPDLVALIPEVKDDKIRAELVKALFHSSMMDGVAVTRERLEQAGSLERGNVDDHTELMSSSYAEEYGSAEFLEWSLELSEGSHPGYPLQEALMAELAQRDLKGAEEWLRRFEGPQELKDVMTERYSLVLGSVDPARGLEWAGKIQDQMRREMTATGIVSEWRDADPEAFQAWDESR